MDIWGVVEESGLGEDEVFVDGFVGGFDGCGDFGEVVVIWGVGVLMVSRKRLRILMGLWVMGRVIELL